MYIFNGKFNWSEYAKNENITIVVPASFSLNDPICAYWQWTDDGEGHKKANKSQAGVISSVADSVGVYRVGFTFESYYHFDATFSDDFSSLTLTMSSPEGNLSDPFTLPLQYGDSSGIPSTSVYIGKLNWLTYAHDEMVTLVVPSGVSDGAPVGLYYQWTVDSEGDAKKNHPVNSTFRAVIIGDNGDVTGTFDDGYYTFEATIPNGGREANIRMSKSSGEDTSMSLTQTDFRGLGTKKALIIRFGTGTDNGIFLVRNMLTSHLGFAVTDVELCYFDVDGQSDPKQCTQGQDPPTAGHFKDKFQGLLSGASAGDVRFLCVDAHGTTYPDNDLQQDTKDRGWVFADDTDWTERSVVYDEWISNTISKNLKPGVNLTIFTSSCIGGGMLDTTSTTPGIILAGCHETQFNVKGLPVSGSTLDPWMYAMKLAINNRVRRKRGVPSYSILFNEAKRYIARQLAAGGLSPEYKGPSPNEMTPIPYDRQAETSNQDPQLSFYSGYIDPDSERFLFPLTTASEGRINEDALRYPRDELQN
ncbi:hypothetical protein C8Q79DRAFT_542574 [Trametes meyenii]|nr:hypothetical protein C8Q79DRAFT_542574 [Trametes meyenii]